MSKITMVDIAKKTKKKQEYHCTCSKYYISTMVNDLHTTVIPCYSWYMSKMPLLYCCIPSKNHEILNMYTGITMEFFMCTMVLWK